MGETRDGTATCGPDSGVYMILHEPSDSGYVGSSQRSTGNRWSWHKSKLKSGEHPCSALQVLWRSTSPEEWKFVTLEEDQENDVRERERFWMGLPKILLNTVGPEGRTHSEETKQRIREGRARYLETPGAREQLAERARRQHDEGNFGRSTW